MPSLHELQLSAGDAHAGGTSSGTNVIDDFLNACILSNNKVAANIGKHEWMAAEGHEP